MTCFKSDSILKQKSAVFVKNPEEMKKRGFAVQYVENDHIKPAHTNTCVTFYRT